MAAALFEVTSVQRSAAPCNRVIHAAEGFYPPVGRYPHVQEMATLEPELASACGYQLAGNGFKLVVKGHRPNPQAYVYDSGIKRWRWE